MNKTSQYLVPAIAAFFLFAVLGSQIAYAAPGKKIHAVKHPKAYVAHHVQKHAVVQVPRAANKTAHRIAEHQKWENRENTREIIQEERILKGLGESGLVHSR